MGSDHRNLIPTQSRPADVKLRDGTPTRVRLVHAGDRTRLIRGVREMSATSRYLRFFTATREVTEQQARDFTEIDQLNHVAVCAVEPTDMEARGYGISRFVRDTHDPLIGEFAVAVIDEMQGRGLGTILMAALYLRAQWAGLRELRGEVLAENAVMPQWFARLGGTVDATSTSAYFFLRWSIAPAGAAPSDPSISRTFVLWLERLRASFGS